MRACLKGEVETACSDGVARARLHSVRLVCDGSRQVLGHED